MALLTVDHVARIMPNARVNGLDKEWDALIQTLHKYEINTKNRIAAFLMNVAKESGELYYVEEIASGWDYEWREDLGNVYAGDGPKFKGRGYIQITGRYNYRNVGDALGINAESNPDLLTQLPYTWLSAGWYWAFGSSWGNLNWWADQGAYKNTIVGVRGGIDPDREHYWHTAMSVLPNNTELPGDAADTPPEPREWPTRLCALDSNGWLYDIQSGAFIRTSDNKSLKGGSNDSGWWFGDVAVKPAPEPDKPEPTKWEWPVANDAPIPGGYYWQEYPTRYNWLTPKSVDGLIPRPDVEAWARYLVDKWSGEISVNTYFAHPPDVYPPSREKDSFDVWGPLGRGDPVDPSVMQAIHDELYNDPGKPDIDWCIWNGWLWSRAWNWVWWGDHYDHGHYTYL